MRTNHAFMKKLQQSDSSNSNYPLHHQKKSTPNSNGHRSNSSNSRKTKFTNREKSTSANKMHKSNQSPSLKSCQEDIANNSSSSNKIPAISTPGIKLQKISAFSYPRRIVLPFSERVMENNNLPTYSSSNISPSVQSNRYSFESSWSNLWRSGLPEQKLTVWLPRRFTDQEDERSQCKLNIFSPSNIKLHKHSFPDLNVKELDNPSIWKSIQKCSPQKFSNSSSYWTPNSHLNGYNSTNDNHSSSGSTII
ncbi:unnamed protein product [Heterobilharzia americana]|nr:unnamed protein product [Heterobilharzia americana]